MTEALYLKDSYLKEWEATVEEVNDKFVILDKTAFYARGGGQPNDEGTITNQQGEEFKVVFVGKFDGKISHEMDKIGLKKGDKVNCKLDWERRYKLMRSHTALHVFAQVLFLNKNVLITGNQMDLEKCRMDFALEENNPEEMKKFLEQANEKLRENLEISIDFKPREEAEKMEQLSKLAKGLPESIKEVRIVNIGNFDIQADGGTHVKNTKEVGQLEFIKTDNRGKNNRRVYFKLIP